MRKFVLLETHRGTEALPSDSPLAFYSLNPLGLTMEAVANQDCDRPQQVSSGSGQARTHLAVSLTP